MYLNINCRCFIAIPLAVKRRSFLTEVPWYSIKTVTSVKCFPCLTEAFETVVLNDDGTIDAPVIEHAAYLPNAELDIRISTRN
jgi:hypothetical protein